MCQAKILRMGCNYAFSNQEQKQLVQIFIGKKSETNRSGNRSSGIAVLKYEKIMNQNWLPISFRTDTKYMWLFLSVF